MPQRRPEVLPILYLRGLSTGTPQARHHFTTLHQVNQLIEASEVDADLGFMARLLRAVLPANCSALTQATEKSTSGATARMRSP